MNIFKSIATISLLTFFSRLLGLIRDTLIVSFFGASTISDSFFISLKFPNFLRRIFAEGAFSQSFLPILIYYKQNKDKNTTKKFLSCTLGLLIFIIVIIVLFCSLFSSYLVIIVAPGFINKPEKFYLTSLLMSINFPYVLLISIASLFGLILNAWNSFFIPSISPILLNASIIFFLIFVSPYLTEPVLALSFSFLLGGILQILYQIPFLKKIDMLIIPNINISNSGVLKLIKNFIPSIIGISINQVSLMINTIFSSFFISGSISWIYYADRLIEFPSGILGVTLNTILLSNLSKIAFKGNIKEYLKLMDWGLRLCILLVLPSSIGLIILAKPIVITLFQYGKFSYFDVLMTKKLLILYSIGLPGLMLVKVLNSVFYSKQDMITPVKISIICLFFTQLLNIILIKLFQHSGLVISIGLSSYLNAFLLYSQVIKKKFFSPKIGWYLFLFKLFVSVIFMSIMLIFMKMMISWQTGSVVYKILRLFLVCLIGGVFYFFVLHIMRFRIKRFFNCNIRQI